MFGARSAVVATVMLLLGFRNFTESLPKIKRLGCCLDSVPFVTTSIWIGFAAEKHFTGVNSSSMELCF